MRLLVVVDTELTVGEERRDWALLATLVGANGPASIDVHVLALIDRPRTSTVDGAFGGVLGASIGSLPRAHRLGYSPAESARQRLDRSLQYLRGLRLRASGDIAPGTPVQAVRRELARREHDRVVLLLQRRPSPVTSVLHLDPYHRLRRRLAIPVVAPWARQAGGDASFMT
jgi:hypothetical protein